MSKEIYFLETEFYVMPNLWLRENKCKQIFTMEQYTPRERSEIVEIYIQQNKKIVKTQRTFKKGLR